MRGEKIPRGGDPPGEKLCRRASIRRRKRDMPDAADRLRLPVGRRRDRLQKAADIGPLQIDPPEIGQIEKPDLLARRQGFAPAGRRHVITREALRHAPACMERHPRPGLFKGGREGRYAIARQDFPRPRSRRPRRYSSRRADGGNRRPPRIELLARRVDKGFAEAAKLWRWHTARISARCRLDQRIAVKINLPRALGPLAKDHLAKRERPPRRNDFVM